jgi:hypothetical protein
VPELRPQSFNFDALVSLRIIERLIRDVPAAAALLPAYLQRADAPQSSCTAILLEEAAVD